MILRRRIVVLRNRGFKSLASWGISWTDVLQEQGRMALSDNERELIRSSFRLAARNRREAAARFYEILFEQAPEARALFVNDLEQQGAELMSKLGLIVAELQNIQGLVPVLEDGGTAVWESLSIVEYLAERHPGVWPADPAARAWARSRSRGMNS